MGKTLLTILYFISFGLSSFGQSTDEVLQKQIDKFFIALETGDSSLMRTTIHPNVFLTTTFTHPNTGEKVYHIEPASQFLSVLGTPHPTKWHEAIANIEFKVDDNLAIAWMDYSFFVDDKFSHCGVNVFEFVKLAELWKITHIIDTRRNYNCNEELHPK